MSNPIEKGNSAALNLELPPDEEATTVPLTGADLKRISRIARHLDTREPQPEGGPKFVCSVRSSKRTPQR